MQGDIVAQGLELMVYGMGSVVVFLALLVVCTMLMSMGINRLFPEPIRVRAAARGARTIAADPDEDVVAAISAAVHQHRRR